MKRNFLIDKDTVSGVSDPFEIDIQVTVMALGLEPLDTVTFSIVQLSDPARVACECPPAAVVFPSIIDDIPLTCCGEPITLSRTRPYVILDAPQGAKIRATLNTNAPPDTQFVFYTVTNTQNVNDRMRGCPCEEQA